MLVCWEWLQQYVELDIAHDDMALKFAMSGLNHESTEQVGSDVVIDLEVTSNRGDCLGHIGVAREAAVLLDVPLKIPAATPKLDASAASDSLKLTNEFTDGCPEFTARVIRGVKVGPSPAWLVRRLASIGINSVNNIVDVTNYVMFECGQPLHAFDLAQIKSSHITVRAAEDKEQFEALDHKTYELDSQMVVIADAERAIGLAGVMGGLNSEVSDATTDIVIEAARFKPLAIRRAARKLKLHSPASYRFERTPDPHGVDWASRRCCELILELAGGTLEDGVVQAGDSATARSPIRFRYAQLERVLGISVPSEDTRRILAALGCEISADDGDTIGCIPPTWRLDLERECDLIEEVARIYGYERIPEDVAVPIGVAAPRPKDIALERARLVLSSHGIDEAMTPSVVNETAESLGSGWSEQTPLKVDTPLLEGAKLLRRSVVPSLLACRYGNQSQSVRNAELYEVATIFLPDVKEGGLPAEQSTLGIITSGDLRRAKGIVELIVQEVTHGDHEIQFKDFSHSLLENGSGLSLSIAGNHFGYLGLASPELQNAYSLDQPVAVAELSVDLLTENLCEVRRAKGVSSFPAITRDLNFVLDETVRWLQLEDLCKAHGGKQLTKVDYLETYRDEKKDGTGKKRLLMALSFQSMERTLRGEEIDEAVQRIVEACKADLGGALLG
ncbi:MAG: phenylalanine--tRNA ligase subunit beta [Planctomycetota bacterium]